MFPFWIIGIFVALSGGAIIYSFSVLIGFLIVAGGIVIIILHHLYSPKYPVTAWIFLKRHNSLRIFQDKATRLKHDDGTFYYKFKKLKDDCPAAEFKNLYPSGKGEILLAYSPAPGEYHPAVFRDRSIKSIVNYTDKDGNTKQKEIILPAIMPIPDDLHQWLVLKQERAKQKYMRQSAWDRYYPVFVAVVLMFAIVFVVYGLFQGMGPVLDEFRSTSGSFRSAADQLSQAIELLAEEQIADPDQPGEPGAPSASVPPDVPG